MLEKIGKYEIRGELGRGGFGHVYLGFDPTVNRPVAIKVLVAAGDPSVLVRFRTEATTAGNLRHKNIVTIYEFGEHQGTFYLVMEYLEGRDLQRVMSEANSLTLVEKIRIMTQVAEGLHFAHQNGVVHRDVKPANIMLLADGTVKIMDFGIARLTRDNSARLTQSGYLIGTVSYMAPEQLNGEEADALCDIWAFGTIYYEFLGGQHPFQATDTTAAMFRITQLEPPRIQTLVPGCPATLDAIITRLLSKNRESRYQSLEDVLFDTVPLLSDLETKQAGTLVTQAGDLIRQGKLDEAQTLVKRILALDPAREDGRALRRELQAAMQRRSNRDRVRTLSEQAERAAAGRDLAGAIQAIESALRIDRDSAGLLTRLAELRAAKERLDLAQSLLARARKDFELNDLTGAFQCASDALGAEPGNVEARQLLSEIQQQISVRDAERLLRDGLAKVKGLLALQSFDEAIQLLEGLTRQLPSSVSAQELLARTRQQREDYNRQRLLRSEIDAAKDLIKNRNFEAAINRLAPLAGEPSCKSEVDELMVYALEELAEADRARKIESIETTARVHLTAQDFEAALACVEAGLRSYPENAPLSKLRQSILLERAQEVQRRVVEQCLDESIALAEAGRFEEAAALLERTLRQYPADAALRAALDTSRKKHQEQRERARSSALENDLKRAEQLLEQGDVFSATQLLQQMMTAYPSEAGVISLLERAQAEEKRRAALVAIYDEIRPFLKAQQLDRATEIIARGKKQFGTDAQLVAFEAEANRKLARQDGFERARRAFGERNWKLAASALEALLAQDSTDTEAKALLAKVQEEELAERRREWRENGRKKAQEFLRNLQFDDAIRCVRALHDEFPQDAAIRDELREVLDAKERHLRREAYAQGQRQIDALLRSGNFNAAIGEIEKLIAQFPEDASLREELATAVATKDEKERRDRSAGEGRRARELVRTRKFDEAAGLLRALLADFPNDPQLQEDLKSALGAKELQERREALDREVGQLEKLYRKGDARGVKEKASRLPPDLQDARIRELLDWAEKETARQAHDQARESADSLRRRRQQRMVWGAAAAAALIVALLIPLYIHYRRVQVILSGPEQLSFSLPSGSPRSSRSFSIYTNGTPVQWSASSTADWLSVEPREGTTPADLNVFVNPGSLSSKSYSAQILFAREDGTALLRTNVTVVITGPVTVSSLKPPDTDENQQKTKLETKTGAGKTTATKPDSQPKDRGPSTEVKPPIEVVVPKPPDVASVKPPPPPPPASVNCRATTWNGPTYGRFTWSGVLPPQAEQVISKNDSRTRGSPGLQGCDDAIVTAPAGIAIVEQPSRADGFLSVKIRNDTNAPISGIELSWREKGK
jgi:eukaryotic-like serine/threonine-protein kinase